MYKIIIALLLSKSMKKFLILSSKELGEGLANLDFFILPFCDIIVLSLYRGKVMKETVYFGTYTRRTSQRDLQGRL